MGEYEPPVHKRAVQIVYAETRKASPTIILRCPEAAMKHWTADPEFIPFASRSVVQTTKGIVACTLPLAAQRGLEVRMQISRYNYSYPVNM